jgi:hypothetical protein
VLHVPRGCSIFGVLSIVLVESRLLRVLLLAEVPGIVGGTLYLLRLQEAV